MRLGRLGFGYFPRARADALSHEAIARPSAQYERQAGEGERAASAPAAKHRRERGRFQAGFALGLGLNALLLAQIIYFGLGSGRRLASVLASDFVPEEALRESDEDEEKGRFV